MNEDRIEWDATLFCGVWKIRLPDGQERKVFAYPVPSSGDTQICISEKGYSAKFTLTDRELFDETKRLTFKNMLVSLFEAIEKKAQNPMALLTFKEQYGVTIEGV